MLLSTPLNQLQVSVYFYIQSTPNNSNFQGKLKKVRVTGSLKQKQMDTEFELEWQKSKDKELTRLF